MPFTIDQLRAIESRDENLLLSAAAGSGKTTVLVERVLRLIRDDGCDIGRMLVVTFTRASAADMRKSLIAALEKEAVLRPDLPHLREQAEKATTAGISTIHAFCGDLLREHFHAANVDPNYRILETAEADFLLDKALYDGMNACYAAMDDDLHALTDNRSLEKIRDLTLKLYRAAFNRPDPFGWIDESVRRLEEGEDIFSPVLLDEARVSLRQARALALRARRLSASTMAPDKLEPLAEDDLRAVEGLLSLDYDGLGAALSGSVFGRWPRIKDWKEDPDTLIYYDARSAIKDAVGEAKKAVSVDRALALQDMQPLGSELRGLGRLVRSVDERFTALKARRGGLTYTDLEHRALLALQSEDVRSALRERYTHILVDEYQDVSDIQESILQAISRENNVFCVGDVKQSIYRFRNAEPGLFQSKYERYDRGEGGQLVLLSQNFRSRQNVIDFINEVFSRVMRGGDTEITYDERAFLRRGAPYEGDDPAVELTLITSEGEENDAGTEDEPDPETADLGKAEAEALWAAGRIRELVGTPTYDVKARAFRPLCFRDIAILTRKGRSVMPLVQQILEREGIPAYADISTSYVEATEVRQALALLSLCDNPDQDLCWLAALRSPAVGLSSVDLAAIRANWPEGSYYRAIQAYAESHDDALSQRLGSFIEQVASWRRTRRHLPLQSFVHSVLTQSRLLPLVGAMRGGERRQANLNMLCDRAAAYERNTGGSLHAFLGYMDRQKQSDDDGEAHIIDENEDVVRIMTTHKSKGLEFQVVFGLMLGSSLKRTPPSGDLLTHPALGLGMKHADNALGSLRDTLPRRAIASKKKAESLAEEMRILYVLMTRARERLILTASVADAEKTLRRVAANIGLDTPPDTALDMLLPAVLLMPGSEALRAVAFEGDPAAPAVMDGAFVRADIVTRSALRLSETQTALDRASVFDRAADAAPDRRWLNAFRWRYPHEDDVYLPLKLTASGLSRALAGPGQLPDIVPRPAFLQEESGRLTGAERGTAMHDALQHIDFDALRRVPAAALTETCRQQLDAMLARGQLTAAQREAVSPGTVARFFSSGAGARMLKAQDIHREWMFTLALSAKEALNLPSDESVLVQGAIDCCFVEDGGWVLLDYKTDRDDDDEYLIGRYAPQLRLYRRALEQITGRPVRQALLCLIRAGREIELRA